MTRYLDSFGQITKDHLKQKRNPRGKAIEDFDGIIPWGLIEELLGKRAYKQFSKWMTGQTCSPHGCYRSDLENYLEGERNLD